MRQEQRDGLRLQPQELLPAEGAPLFILLDGALLDAPRLAYSHDHNPVLEVLYQGTRHDAAAEVSPCLVLPSDASGLWAVDDQWRDCGIVIQSVAGINALSAHLRSLISMRLPSRQLAYCRFYSPDWLQRFFDSCTPEEFSALSGPVQRWFTADGDAWQGFGPKAAGPIRRAEDEGWFYLRQEQLDQLQATEEENFIERMARHFDCPLAGAHEGIEPRQRLAGLIQQARALGFDKEYQCTHYLELAWRFPDAIAAKELRDLLGDRNLAADGRLEQAESRLFGLA